MNTVSNRGSWFPKTKTQKGSFKGVFIKAEPSERGNSYNSSEEPQPTLIFSFELETNEVVKRTFSATTSPKGALYTFFKSMNNLPVSDSDISSPTRFKEIIEGLYGMEFLLDVEPNKTGQYLNIIGIKPNEHINSAG